MALRCRSRTPMMAGHWSMMCSGVSASSLQTIHRPSRHAMPLHCSVHSGLGFRLIRWIFCAEPDQWPARSWCSSTAVSRGVSLGCGSGRWLLFRVFYQPTGHSRTDVALVARSAARYMVWTSTGACRCDRSAASLAMESAASLAMESAPSLSMELTAVSLICH